ncbi:MAG: helix-turn-helix transcriptional regulator [Chitinophagaceae bacterium]
MAKKQIPVYDICSLSRIGNQDDHLLADRFADYLHRHYDHLHFPHRHSFYHLVLFTKGKGSHTIDFDQFPVKPYQIYFMIPGQVHSWHFNGVTEGYIINFSADFFKSFLQNQHYLDQFDFFNGISEEGVRQLPPALHKEVVGLFEAILIASSDEGRHRVDRIRLLLLQLFIQVDGVQRPVDTRPAAPQKQLLLKSFRRLIDTHYRTMRLPKEYADLLYVTPNHLNALVQDLLGKTAGELIRDRILLEAKRLLVNAEMTVTEIAYELNFEDNSYFNRFFKKYTGVTPEEFRKQSLH